MLRDGVRFHLIHVFPLFFLYFWPQKFSLHIYSVFFFYKYTGIWWIRTCIVTKCLYIYSWRFDEECIWVLWIDQKAKRKLPYKIKTQDTQRNSGVGYVWWLTLLCFPAAISLWTLQLLMLVIQCVLHCGLPVWMPHSFSLVELVVCSQGITLFLTSTTAYLGNKVGHALKSDVFGGIFW